MIYCKDLAEGHLESRDLPKELEQFHHNVSEPERTFFEGLCSIKIDSGLDKRVGTERVELELSRGTPERLGTSLARRSDRSSADRRRGDRENAASQRRALSIVFTPSCMD
ncbi:hypothetical protein J6590_020104 [Homalodisca vitripennis]|nr:hypothetical protein J6590_020104 [Homalodisca vitripennis]